MKTLPYLSTVNFIRSIFNRKPLIHPNLKMVYDTIHQEKISAEKYKSTNHYKKLLTHAYDVVLHELLNSIKHKPKLLDNSSTLAIPIPTDKILTIYKFIPDEHKQVIHIHQFIIDVNSLFVDQGFQSYPEVYNVKGIVYNVEGINSEITDVEINFVFPNYKTQYRI